MTGVTANNSWILSSRHFFVNAIPTSNFGPTTYDAVQLCNTDVQCSKFTLNTHYGERVKPQNFDFNTNRKENNQSMFQKNVE